MKKQFVWMALLLSLFILAGCAKEEAVLRISPEIEQYSPTMSSVPGIGLIAVYSRDLKNSDYKYHWETEEGVFLKWSESGSGRITELGPSVYTNEHKVYWTIRPEEGIEKDEIRVHVSVVNIKSDEVLDEASLTIRKAQDGIYYPKD